VSLPSILGRIVAARRARYGVAPGESGAARAPASGVGAAGVAPAASGGSPFVAALRAERSGRRAVIAEVKMGSPRLGSLAGRVDPERQARLYGEHGAAALSVVVEPDFFFGSWSLLRRAKAAAGLPAVAKDFVVAERQLDEAAAAGADALLLIAALYSPEELRAWAAAARARGLVPLVETHAREEIERLAGAEEPWELVGINSRDLHTFEIDLERSIALRPLVPPGALAVAESGIASRADAERLAAAGFDALLVGESLLLAGDAAAQLVELVG
jgi:indole-3-glycerol phosphate synthase